METINNFNKMIGFDGFNDIKFSLLPVMWDEAPEFKIQGF